MQQLRGGEVLEEAGEAREQVLQRETKENHFETEARDAKTVVGTVEDLTAVIHCRFNLNK